MACLALVFGCALCVVYLTSAWAVSIDCSQSEGSGERTLEIEEVEKIGYVVAEFTNTSGDVRWKVEYSRKPSEYLDTFFRSVRVEGQEHTTQLVLNKVLDLEYLHLAFPPLQMLTRHDINDMTFDLRVTCIDTEETYRVFTLHVVVEAVNEFYPQFTGAPFSVKVPESLDVGSTLIDLSNKADDMDVGRSTLTFDLAPYIISEFDGRRFVRVDEVNPGRLLLATPLDYESFQVKGRTYFFLNVTVADDGGFTSVTSVNVTVTDVDDQGIQFVYPECNRPCEHVTYTAFTNESYVGRLELDPTDIWAEDLDLINDTILYSLVSPDDKYFGIDLKIGVLHKKAPLFNDTYGYNISLTIRAEEALDPNHFLTTNVIVFIEERKDLGEKWALVIILVFFVCFSAIIYKIIGSFTKIQK